jgi:predicted RNA polymerase sigma factor
LGPVPALERRALELEQSLGNTDAALARLEALASSSERPESWLKLRGDLLAKAGRSAEARDAYAAALAALERLPAWVRESPDAQGLHAVLAASTVVPRTNTTHPPSQPE